MQGLRGEMQKALLLVLLCWTSLVKLEDSIESSGAGEVTERIISEFFETSASGAGPDTSSDSGINVGILSDLADEELNGTYIPIAPNNGNLNAMNDTLPTDLSDTTTKRHETTISTTTQEMTTPSTTMRETILTDKMDEPVTTTTDVPLEATTLVATTKTPSTTVAATTARKTTRRTTTRTPPSKTLKPLVSTTSTTDANYELPSCSFIKEDLECSVEITCFGDGELDCTETDETEPSVTTSSVSYATEDEYDDEYEETVVTSTEPSQLLHRISPWKRLSAMRRYRLSSATATHIPERGVTTTAKTSPNPTTELATTQEPPTTEPTTLSSDTTVDESTSAANTAKPGTETENTKMLHVELPTMPSEDSSIQNGSSEIQASTSEKSPELPGTVTFEVNTGKMIESSSSSSFESVDVVGSTSRKRRSKRQNKHPLPDSSVLSSSESLKLSSRSKDKEQEESRFCRIKGNLRCSPLPTLGICKGSGRCQVPVEKKEKSTAGSGVENWAIAVIAICATAAAVTLILLMYLVITSWKKLKVQPQNGVTT